MIISPLKQSALIFAIQAGYCAMAVKLKENRASIKQPAWDVFVKSKNAVRGKKIGTIFYPR